MPIIPPRPTSVSFSAVKIQRISTLLSFDFLILRLGLNSQPKWGSPWWGPPWSSFTPRKDLVLSKFIKTRSSVLLVQLVVLCRHRPQPKRQTSGQSCGLSIVSTTLLYCYLLYFHPSWIMFYACVHMSCIYGLLGMVSMSVFWSGGKTDMPRISSSTWNEILLLI